MSSTQDLDQGLVAKFEEKESPTVTRHEIVDVQDERTRVAKGDDSDGRVNWTWKQVIATISLCGVYVGSQIPLYFVGEGSLSYIAADLGTVSTGWLPVSNSLALAAVCPFCGYLQDMFGKRNISILGSVLIMVGVLITATAKTFAQGVVGMTIAGGGAAIGELTALAGTAELVPVKKRGIYLACVTFFICPFFPYVLYAQLLSANATWRWGLWITFIYNGVFFVGVLLFYFPDSHILRKGDLSRAEIAKKIDYVGAVLSITGVILFLVALQSGGSSHPWTSAYVLCMLFIGAALIAGFVMWEWKGAKYPMVPRDLFVGQRVVAIALAVAFVSGMNFYSMINFAPLTYSTVYNPDPIQVGVKGLGYSIAITVGATVMNALLTILKGNNRELLLISCVLMTAFTGSMAAVNPNNPGLAVGLATVAGFGIGGVIVPSATIAMTACPDSLIATATALTLTIRFVGGSIGYSIYYNVFVEKLTNKLPERVLDFALQAGLPTSSATDFVQTFLTVPANVTSVPGVTPIIINAATIGTRWAYSDALAYVWYVSIPFGALSIVGCLLIGDISKYMTNRIAVQIRH
ncbi:uncharacterized protein Z519_11807 [Cladophialophora bantiana CBS 173.52]|uniref:Major facilitator superfamily (MFS) profile domain-containing protein n=1 Tax=Cladophialophora bantiana (strain ATCC 10958 / CBS 173.52 / CDC B-1940 / NIH 8579) TaxID=1442370 RepID=A0A0D2HSU0_CLAB1|nr:uncharacterized protein Z519_11807 [Cladophialophora bantiana CBS 173.52]KIW87484.1 hypothetical protein Z519_11807 [Cladophialophora bantiana CBS 173.52]